MTDLPKSSSSDFPIKPLNPKRAAELFEAYFANLPGTHELTEDQKAVLQAVLDLSPYLRNCIEREPGFVLESFISGFDPALEKVVAVTLELGTSEDNEAMFMAELRKAKQKVAVLCGIADLAGYWKDQQVTASLSRFARAALSASFDFLLLQLDKTGKLKLADSKSPQIESGLVVLGMGKFGADELNYSSDIDLIIFHDSSAGVELLTDDPVTLLNRMGKQLI
ncbi:MAG: hypothetical protein ACR2O3_10350, partial [Rhizobiaceae bacterium]